MSRRGRGAAFNFGPFMIQPKDKREARASRVKLPPPVLEHDGWPDLATWGVATAIPSRQLAAMAQEARAQAVLNHQATTEPRQTTVAVALLADMLHGWAEERAGIASLPPLAAHLARAGMGVVSWDAIARRALS